MKKIAITIAIILVVALLVAGTIFLLRGNEDTWICQSGVWVKYGNPPSPMPTEPCLLKENLGPIDENSNDPRLIGGDKDEHGCLVAAGYSWCETKQKCLRTWEEICPPN